jgi:hypothetical protein
MAITGHSVSGGSILKNLLCNIACGGHVCKWIGTKLPIFIEDLPRILPNELLFIWPSDFRGDDFLEINQSETRILLI